MPLRRANEAARFKWSRKQDLREPECNLGEDRDQRRAQAHQNKEWRSIERDTQDGRMRQALNDKQIEADRWGDLGQLNHDHEEDPEPDRIKSGGDDQWQCDRQAHHSDGDAFKEHAQNNVKHRQGAVRRQYLLRYGQIL